MAGFEGVEISDRSSQVALTGRIDAQGVREIEPKLVSRAWGRARAPRSISDPEPDPRGPFAPDPAIAGVAWGS
jgi:hypothetical protein